MLATTSAGMTDKGRVREYNEDQWFADPEHGLYIVSDGIGGALAGALASKIVVESLPLLLRKRMKSIDKSSGRKSVGSVLAAIKELSNQVRKQTADQPGLDGMGATIVAALVREEDAIVAHMGDSRAYLLCRGHLAQLTRDHTLGELLVESGDIEAGDSEYEAERRILTRYVGMAGEPLPEAASLHLQPADRLLLCTDGLTGMLDDSEILSILAEPVPEEAICRRLIDTANKAGGKDNITVVVIAIE